ncbi:4'-phosphopantetheinyl transferase family protein [Microbulbifer taiwanensis]|uniref:Enterobactin synthase component D n=1 Tax=Microbulbifer taiwanensis TaxID=986746 RepID=A0ABW1YIX7_9GAMM|nr:4'-phosphopantetheinyl transferase superfamily protein [Microbulbifer taiwanensis]
MMSAQVKLRHQALRGSAIIMCRFDAEYYSDMLFTEYDINFPVELVKAVPKRKAEFLAGRYCAKHALLQLGYSDSNVVIGKNRSPVWPRGSVGSISHDRARAIAIVKPRVALSDSIGVDIEKWVADFEVQNLRSVVTIMEEEDLFVRLNLSVRQVVTIIFSAKESFFKAVHHQIGEYFGFEEARVTDVQKTSTGALLSISVSDYLKGRLFSSKEYEVITYFEPDGVLTFCSI